MDFAGFEEYCKDEFLAPSTISNLLVVLGGFRKWLLSEGLLFSEGAATEFLKFKRRTISPAGHNKYVKAFKLYGKFSGADWTEKLRKLKEKPQPRPVPTKEEIEKIIAVDPPPSKYGVFFTLMAFTGARSSEVKKLTISDVEGEFIYFRETKTGDNRKSAIPPRVASILQDYIQRLNGELLFESRQGGIVTNRAINKALRFRLKEAGIKRKITSHRFRHSYITRQVKGSTLKHVQEQVGHKKIETTAMYIHPDEEDLKELARSDPFLFDDLENKELIKKIQDYVMGMKLHKRKGLDFSKIQKGLGVMWEAV